MASPPRQIDDLDSFEHSLHGFERVSAPHSRELWAPLDELVAAAQEST